jgi:signal transduction histidine kinase
MKLILSLAILVVSISVHAQTYKHELVKAYHCETDSCAEAQFALAQELNVNDTTQAWYDYFKFWYNLKIKQYDSSDYYYPISQNEMEDIQDWKLYFNSLDAYVNTLQDRGRYDEVVKVLKDGIVKSEVLDLTVYNAKLHIKQSYNYHDLGLYKEGVEQGKIAKQLLDTTTTEYVVLMDAINTIAISFDDWGKSDSALYYHFLNVGIGLEKTDLGSASSTLNNIGNTYLKRGEVDSAKKYFRESLILAKESNRVSTLATVLTNLGDISLIEGDLNGAKQYLDSALFYAEIDKRAPEEKRRDVYRVLYRYYEQTGDMANAFLYQGKYIAYRDSMHNLEQIEELKDLELQATTAQKDKEIAQAELEVQNRNLWILGIGALLLLALAFVRQLYLKRQQTAQQAQLKLQEERLRISRDLHDNIGAELTYISSVIDQKSFGMKDPEERREYERLSDSSRSAMAQLRETIWAIKTEEITIEKFATKLNELSRKYSEGLGVKLSIAQSGENYLLPPAKVINLFRVCQEGINNAVKYSGCSEIRIELNAEQNQLNMSIVDDGNGFDTETTKTGYGLQNMRERIEEIGGKYTLTSEKETGTHIRIQLSV